MLCLFKRFRTFNVIKTSVRYKNPPHHWSSLKKVKSSSQKALKHFDDFYADIYGDFWENIREALLIKNHNYIAVVNNFSDTNKICEELECLGAINISRIYDVNKKKIKRPKVKLKEKVNIDVYNSSENTDIVSINDEIDDSKYSIHDEEDVNTVKRNSLNEPLRPFKLQSIEKDVTVEYNSSRIINSSVGIPASQLNEFVPATKIKGMDNFILESEHYNYYHKGDDFTVKIEKEGNLNFPEMLRMYTFPNDVDSKFPKPKTGSTGVSDYFVLDSASVLPVLSLDLKANDRVLDMCAAPGGKALIALQSLLPTLIVANDIQESRIKRIKYFYNEFAGNILDRHDNFIITMSDARTIEDKNIYNKVLVDVPCTTDRHTLHENDNNIFKSTRIKERLKLPEVQTQILVNALKLVTRGGTVVYSTCTLSPIQNDGVIQMALKTVYEQCKSVFVVKDQTEALLPLKYLYEFGNFGLRYGHIVVPVMEKNKGPLYFCKMVKIK